MNEAVRPTFVVDMNLSARWVDALASIGYDAVHWSTVGGHDDSDADIMSWARVNRRVVFTFDLDFGTLLALTHVGGPSVLQARMSEALPRQILPVIRNAIDRHCDDLLNGALVIVDETKTRVRVLPL